ncbi:MAG: insulinase family protein [Alphaproteobacteria bacterium]|nr:insulinase family protein [Alphaproteobacteria bacterium]
MTLENGLKILVLPDPSTPAVTHMVWYQVGAADDPKEHPGLAHFLEHMMFRGSKNLSPGQFSRLISAEGGQENAFTTRDMTVFHQQVAADRLELVMRLEAERMAHLTLDPEEVDRERQVILEERRARVENHPASMLKEQMRGALFHGTSFAHPTLGSDHDIRSIRVEDLQRFYREHYQPNRAMLVVAGNVTPETVKTLAERHFGPLRASQEQKKPVSATLSEPPAEPLTLAIPHLKQALWMRDYLAPSQATENKEHAYPLLVLAHVLGGSEVSRLARSLIYEKKIVSEVSTSYNDLSRFPTSFSLVIAPAESIPASLPQLVEDELRRIAKDGVTTEELTLAKSTLTAQAVYGRDSTAAIATLYGTAAATHASTDYPDTLIAKLDAVGNDDIKAAAEMLLKQPQVTGHLIPEPLLSKEETP